MSKSFKNLWVFDPNRDILENWQNADPLSYAWFAFSRSELQDPYRDSGSKPPSFSKSLQLEMRLELRDRISIGELIALGIQTSPIPKSIAEKIAKPFFAASSVHIDWDHDRILGLGLEFHEVRLCFTDTSNSNQLELIAPNPPIAKRGGGRPNGYPKAKEILEFLYRDENNRKMPPIALLGAFNDEFLKRYTEAKRRIAPVAERTLHNYINCYRKELAETGRD